MRVSELYSKLLGLYPAEFQAQFGGEMRAVFEQAVSEHESRARARFGLFIAKEFLGLFAGVGRERLLRSASHSSVEELPFPSDIAGAEEYVGVVSKRLIQAIAHHDFAGARRYDLLDRQARALLAELRSQPVEVSGILP